MPYITVEAHLRKEAEWDQMLSTYPRCVICGGVIFPDSIVYVAKQNCVCKSCKEELDDGMEIY